MIDRILQYLIEKAREDIRSPGFWPAIIVIIICIVILSYMGIL